MLAGTAYTRLIDEFREIYADMADVPFMAHTEIVESSIRSITFQTIVEALVKTVGVFPTSNERRTADRLTLSTVANPGPNARQASELVTTGAQGIATEGPVAVERWGIQLIASMPYWHEMPEGELHLAAQGVTKIWLMDLLRRSGHESLRAESDVAP